MKKYPGVKDIQNKIEHEGTAYLTFHAADMNAVIHPYSVPGYEYLSGGFVEFLDRFRTIIPGKVPIVLEITGREFDDAEKEIIDKAIWMHYGLNLSEAARNLKKMRIRMFIYVILMVLSSSLLFLVSGIANEVITNYAYILFWFFGYRILTHLILDYQPILKEYQWNRRLSALKLIFADEKQVSLDSEAIARENLHYVNEATRLTRKDSFVEHVLMEESYVSLGCRIEQTEEVIFPSGAGDLEIVSDEMASYLMSAIPFIRQKAVTKLAIEGREFSEKEQNRIASAIRNYLAFTISDQDAEGRANKGVSLMFAAGLLLSSLVLFAFGKDVDLAIHEFILVSFWFFADYLLEFAVLSREKIRYQKKTLEKLANMDITFETKQPD